MPLSYAQVPTEAVTANKTACAASCIRVGQNLRKFTDPVSGGVYCAGMVIIMHTQPVPQQALILTYLVELLALVQVVQGNILGEGLDCKDSSRLMDVKTAGWLVSRVDMLRMSSNTHHQNQL